MYQKLHPGEDDEDDVIFRSNKLEKDVDQKPFWSHVTGLVTGFVLRLTGLKEMNLFLGAFSN